MAPSAVWEAALMVEEAMAMAVMAAVRSAVEVMAAVAAR